MEACVIQVAAGKSATKNTVGSQKLKVSLWLIGENFHRVLKVNQGRMDGPHADPRFQQEEETDPPGVRGIFCSLKLPVLTPDGF